MPATSRLARTRPRSRHALAAPIAPLLVSPPLMAAKSASATSAGPRNRRRRNFARCGAPHTQARSASEGLGCGRASILFALLIATASLVCSSSASERPVVLVVVGAEGTKEYGESFREWAGRWEKAAGLAQAELAT